MSHFTPLKTYKGLSINELITLIDGRDLYIWGCGYLGQILKRYFDKNGLEIKSFCDSDHKLHMSYVDNVKVINPKDIFNKVKLRQAYIIIASSRYKNEIEKVCFDAGLQTKDNFLSYIHISRPEVAIDIAGKCNLKCPSCPQGNMENIRPEGCMSAPTYKQVLSKLLRELPSTINIELSTWGEPFMNSELAQIIQMTEESIPCAISTNLQVPDQLENVIKAQPSQITISASGFGKSYEVNHAGGSWRAFLDNIHYLKELIDKHNPKTQFNVLYHLYRYNQGDDLDKFRNLCRKLDLKLITTWAYLNPYDKFLDYCEERDIGIPAKKVLDNLTWDLNCVLELSKAEANKPCLCQRIFPIINCDLSVSLCHIFYNPIIAHNFLDMPLKEIIELRHKQFHCEKCQNYGLHRLDIEVLLRKYSPQNIFYN